MNLISVAFAAIVSFVLGVLIAPKLPALTSQQKIRGIVEELYTPSAQFGRSALTAAQVANGRSKSAIDTSCASMQSDLKAMQILNDPNLDSSRRKFQYLVAARICKK